jgi:hypothetical protein
VELDCVVDILDESASNGWEERNAAEAIVGLCRVNNSKV